MLKILPIASGSTGNSMLVDIGGRKIVIDLGVTAKMIGTAMAAHDYTWSDIDAVLITHTHSDHVKGMDVCLKRIEAPVYMSQTSKDTLMLERAMPLAYAMRTEIMSGLWITAIRTSHDCPGSVGFKIETENTCLGYITDLGIIPDTTMELLSDDQCAEAVSRFADRGTRHFLLAHLSQENNLPELALDSAQKASAGMNVHIEVLPVYGDGLIVIEN